MTVGNRIAGAVGALCCAAELGFVVLFVVYALAIASSNHTGIPLGLVWAFASATGLVSAASLVLRQKSVIPRRIAWCLLFSSLLALLTLSGFERLNVMMEYATWARKGMPERP